VYNSPFSSNITRWSAPDAIFTTTLPGNISIGCLSIPFDERPIVPLESWNRQKCKSPIYGQFPKRKMSYAEVYSLGMSPRHTPSHQQAVLQYENLQL
jgi:hypothetical protein